MTPRELARAVVARGDGDHMSDAEIRHMAEDLARCEDPYADEAKRAAMVEQFLRCGHDEIRRMHRVVVWCLKPTDQGGIERMVAAYGLSKPPAVTSALRHHVESALALAERMPEGDARFWVVRGLTTALTAMGEAK